MKATQLLHDLGQSLWLDNITRDLLNTGTLKRYIDELSVTGLTSNPTIFDHAIKNSSDLRCRDPPKIEEGKSGEALFFELALEDLTRAADLFRPIYDQTNGVDGWVSLEVSPLLAHDTASTLAAAKDLHARAGRPNLFIKIPGTKEGLARDRRGDFRGHADQRDALFSHEQYVAAAEAFLRGIERRIDAGLKPDVGSVASCSSAAGMSPCRQSAGDAGQPVRHRCCRSARTKPTALCSIRRGGSVSLTPAPVRSASSGPARERRIPMSPISCM